MLLCYCPVCPCIQIVLLCVSMLYICRGRLDHLLSRFALTLALRKYCSTFSTCGTYICSSRQSEISPSLSPSSCLGSPHQPYHVATTPMVIPPSNTINTPDQTIYSSWSPLLHRYNVCLYRSYNRNRHIIALCYSQRRVKCCNCLNI